MKKLCILFAVFLLAACGTSGSKSASDTKAPVDESKLVSYSFKVDGLQDSVLSDTIWKMIFQVDGIDKLVISKNDSSVLFSVDPSKVSQEQIKAEIQKRGGTLLMN